MAAAVGLAGSVAAASATLLTALPIAVPSSPGSPFPLGRNGLAQPFIHGEIQLTFTLGEFYNVAIFECLLSTETLTLAKKYLKSYSLSHLCFVFLVGACIETYGFDGRSHSPENLC